MQADELRRRAEAIKWYHGGIDLGHGVITQGMSQPAMSLMPHISLPNDLTGKTVLDIGAWDGYMSWECERRNARRVVAVDSFIWDRERQPLSGWDVGDDGFRLAHEALGSKVEPIFCEVLDISPETMGGTFDVVLFLGVLYHMRHPLLALERVASVTDDLLILESHTALNHIAGPAMEFYPGRELCNDGSNWWGPNAHCIAAMLGSVGFQRSVQIAGGGRTVFHAWKQ